MKFLPMWPMSIQLVGFLEDPHDDGPTRASGTKSRAKIRIPCQRDHRYDVVQPLVAFGRAAERLLGLAREGALVTLTGRLATIHGFENHILIDGLEALDLSAAEVSGE